MTGGTTFANGTAIRSVTVFCPYAGGIFGKVTTGFIDGQLTVLVVYLAVATQAIALKVTRPASTDFRLKYGVVKLFRVFQTVLSVNRHRR